MLIENQLKKLGFGTAAVFLLIVAVLLGVGPMYLMAVIMGLVPFAGWVVNRIIMQGLICTRSAPETADENGRILVTITLENAGYFPKFYLRVIDSLPPLYPVRRKPGRRASVRDAALARRDGAYPLLSRAAEARRAPYRPAHCSGHRRFWVRGTEGSDQAIRRSASLPKRPAGSRRHDLERRFCWASRTSKTRKAAAKARTSPECASTGSATRCAGSTGGPRRAPER